ncbi:hypothetical protein LEP1GSC133_0306 [Leptospira borgpetersenii serovar Pomona str. 200901868]|uniref:Uncharacterized protein n=1 Tax=Leptospira borgpetersenii serovar Pomona str. 200901868 TaxID=1192866 RepID=M6VSS2_LEPBO|nr:hypothetical protein LEP1GSC133_0306 [Leptospira borgpetersenii serovar Pomona str. 200901868]
MLKDGKVTHFGPIEECFTEKNLENLYDIPLQVQKIEGTWFVIPKQK